jgi:ribonuclease HI
MNNNSKKPTMPPVDIYTDGGCEPNPDPGGYGVVLLHPRKRAEARHGRAMTNDQSPMQPKNLRRFVKLAD